MLIRYYGPVGIPGGYGTAANETCMAILAAGLDLEIQTYNPSPGADHENRLPMRYAPLVPCVRTDGNPPRSNPDVVIVHTKPADCAKLLEIAQIRTLYPKAHCVAYTTWECASPIRLESLALFDQIWVPSKHTLSSMTPWAVDDGGLRVVPHAYDETTVVDADGPTPLKPFRFYCIGAWTRRKNPEGVIQAYLRAFHRNDDVELVIQSAGAPVIAMPLAVVAATGQAPVDQARICCNTQYLSESEMWHLHHNCDCFVTASRGESWNLPAFDAMLAGRHIISPRELGSLDFLQDTSAWLYDARLAPAGGEARVTKDAHTFRAIGCDFTVQDDWWEPDIADLARNMRRAYCERRRDLTVHYSPAKRYGRRSVGDLIRRLLEAGM